MEQSTSAKTVQCVVVTPERAVLDESVDFVVLPMYDGELGVLPGRAPLIGRLGYGELRTRRGNEIRRFFVDGGFAQVNGTLNSFHGAGACMRHLGDHVPCPQHLAIADFGNCSNGPAGYATIIEPL